MVFDSGSDRSRDSDSDSEHEDSDSNSDSDLVDSTTSLLVPQSSRVGKSKGALSDTCIIAIGLL